MKIENYKEMMFLVSLGHTAVEIGAKLDLNPRTIEKRLEVLRAAYGAKNTPHLIAIAFRNKIIK